MANKIIGNTEYKAIRDKAYINGTQENVMQLAAELDKAGINYSGRVSEYRSAITVEAADRAKALEIMNRILYAAKEKTPAENTEKNIIGNTEYRYIANKRYVKGETEIMLRIADRLAAENISFSGRISGDTATVTVSGDETQELVKKYFAEEKNRSENIQSAYFLALSSDTFEDGYYISEVNTTTGEEIAPYRSSIGDIPMFLSVEEAVKSAESEGITLSNSAEQLDSWRNIEAEKERQSALARSRELISQLPETEKGFDEYFVLRENAADWVYFNPDGADGEGQFIVTTLYAEDLLNAYNARSSTADYEKQGQDAFIGIIENGKQTVISADTKEFERYALSCINSRNKENVIVSAPVVSGSGYDENFENIIERLENHFDDVKKHKDRVLSDSYADITDRITDKQNEITAFITNEDFTAAEAALSELKQLLGEAEKIKTKIQSKEITLDDVNALRSIQPARKSVQNMLENEVAKTPKFEKLLGDEMGEKSAFEMRNSDNEWRNDESKTAVVVNVPKVENAAKPVEIRKRNDIPRGTFTNRDTGLEIIFGRRSIEETIVNAIYDDKRNLPVEARLAALYQMKDIIENAVCFDSQLSEPSSSRKSDNTLFIHRMYGLFTYDNEQYLANLAVEETYATDRDNKFRDTQNRVYNVNDIKITPVRLLGDQAHAIPQEASTDTSTGVTKITIPQLYEIVKAYDEYFFENPKAAGRLDREAEIEEQNKFKKAMETLAENEKENSIENALNIKDNPILFSVVTLDGGDDIVIGGYIDDDNVRYMDEYLNVVSESNSDTVDVQVHFYTVGDGGNEAVDADTEQAKYISQNLNEVLKQADLLESNRYSVEITDDEIANSDRNTREKNLEFTVITFEDGSVYVEGGQIDDNNVKDTAAYSEMFKNNFDVNNIEDLDESIKVEYAVYRMGDGDVVMPTGDELAEIRTDLDHYIDGINPVSEENSYLQPWQNDDDILYGMTEMWKKRHNDDPQISDRMDSDYNLLPKNLKPTSRSGGVGYYDTLSSVRQIKLSGSEWLDPFAAAVEMNRRGVDYNDIELLNVSVIDSTGYYTEKDMTPEQFAVFEMRIDNDPLKYDELISSNRKRITEREKGLAEAQNALENDLSEIVRHSVASDELEDISEKIFTDDTVKRAEIAKQYIDGAFSFDSIYINTKKTDDNVVFSLENGFEITYPWSEVAAAFEQAAINEMEWYYTSGEVLEVYKKALEKDTAVVGALDVQLDRAVFTDWVSDITARQNSVRTAYEANDKALFESTVRREVDNYFYMLCDKDESIEGYNLKDISDFVNAFCRNEFLRKEIYSAVSENVDLSLGVMEKAKEAAHKAGLPFREAVADPEEEFNPYAFDGTMSPEDYELMHKLMREDSVIFKDEDFPLDTTAEQLAGRFTESHEGKFKVEEYFQNNHPTTEELAAFIKDLLENQRQGFGIKDYASDQNGVTFTDLSRYSWEQIAQAVVKAMEKETYITPEERAAKADVPKYTIYQIKEGEDYRNTRFTNWNDLKRFDIPFDKNNYDFVYSGNVSDVSKNHSNGVILEDIFKKFNTDHPEDFKGHSLSVSDVITLEDKNGKSAFFVDSYGMTDVTDLFFDMEKQKIDLSKLSEITLKEEYDRRKDKPDDFLHIKNTITFSNLNSSYLIGRYKEFTYEYDDMPDLDEGDTFTTKQAMLDEVREFLEDMRKDHSKSISITDTDGKTTTLEGLFYEFEATEDRLAFMLPGVGYAEMFERDDDSYDYTFYDKNFKVVDSGVYDDVSITIRQAFANVLEDAGFDIGKCEPMDFEKLHDRVKEKAEQSRATDIQTEINELTAEENRAAVDKIEVGAKFSENTQGKIKPIYGKTREEAIEAGEQELYFDDRQENRDCISAIERSISENNDGSHFNGNKAITDLLSEYSVDRIALVIAARVSDAGKWDRRFSRENVEWAEKTLQAFDTEQSAAISRTRFTSHSVLLNDVADELRKNYEMFRSMQNKIAAEEKNADKMPSSQTETNETAVHNAFQKLKENHDFSPEVLKLLDRAEKHIIGNDLDNFNSKIFEVPLFQQTYGSVSRVNEKLFGGDLRSVIDEVNGYIFDEKNAEMNSTDIEARHEQMSLFGSSPRRVSSDEIPRDRIDETKEAADVPAEDIKLKTVVIDLTPKEEYNREQPKEKKTEKENNDFTGYVISEDDFGEAGGAKSRYAANIEAIKTLKAIEAENRTADPEEQSVLAGYTGWGAIPQAFDGNNDKWKDEFAELKELLTPEEYAAARKSTMNAHYTSPTVISAIYDGLKNLGFDGGKILEPAMGIGNFFGVCPENIRSNSELYGVELDSITGRIAQQLYPNVDVQIKGFEKTNFPDNSFDVALSNVPLGDYPYRHTTSSSNLPTPL